MVAVHRQEKQVLKYTHPTKSFSQGPLRESVASQTQNNQNITTQDDHNESAAAAGGEGNMEDVNNNSNNTPDCEETGQLQEETSRRSFSFRRSNSSGQSLDKKERKKKDFRRTKQVATQAILYIGAFYFTYFFATLNRILQQINGSSPFVVLLLHSLTLPQQG
jgi:hypothetical protein